MRIQRILLLPLIVLLQLHLAGCGGGAMPKTAADIRQDPLAIKETFEVSRAFENVVATFKRNTHCLDATVKKGVSTGAGQQVIVNDWNPTFLLGDDKAEFHLQRIEQGVIEAEDEPEKGHFIMVMDIRPASIQRTRIDLYRPMGGFEPLVKVVKSWATGKDIVCPDMTKI